MRFPSYLTRALVKGQVNLETGHGTGLIPVHTLLALGKYRLASRRISKAIRNPRAALALARSARTFRARYSG